MQAAATRLGFSDRAGRGGLAPGSSGQAPLHCSTPRGTHPQLRPATDLPACLPHPPCCFWQLKGRCSLLTRVRPRVLSPSCTDPRTGWGARPALLRGAGRAGGLKDAGRGGGAPETGQKQAGGGAGVIQPRGPLHTPLSGLSSVWLGGEAASWLPGGSDIVPPDPSLSCGRGQGGPRVLGAPTSDRPRQLGVKAPA